MGFMGSGKSLYGRLLADHFGYKFYDLDDEIVHTAGLSIPEIFESRGEEVFRKLERECLGETIHKEESFVLALGGGTPCHRNNWAFLEKATCTIYLDRTTSQILKNVSRKPGKRPLLKDKSMEELAAYVQDTLVKRMPHYTKAGIRAKLLSGEKLTNLQYLVEILKKQGEGVLLSNE